MVMRAIETSLVQLLHPIEMNLDELFQGQAEKKTVFMLLPLAKSKSICQMLLVVSSKSLSLMFVLC